MNLKAAELKCNSGLRNFTTIKIGGEAKHFFVINSSQMLKEVIKEFQGSCYILGGGSNLLIKDGIIKKAVIKLGECFDYIAKRDDSIEVGGSTRLSYLLNFCCANNLSGFDNLAGIPASIGGLVRMNASSFGKEISALVREVEVMDGKGNIKRIKKEQIHFSYRDSSLKGYIILRIWFDLVYDNSVKQKISEYLKKRLISQDFEFPSCGCIFKNPNENSAGFLIDSCGLKGLSRNDAKISNKHANFIINLNKARYEDVDYLINYIKEKVHSKFGVLLEEEIKRWS